jgi:hypothetical protein
VVEDVPAYAGFLCDIAAILGMMIQEALYNTVPILATFSRSTLGYRESNCFFRGPETLMEVK